MKMDNINRDTIAISQILENDYFENIYQGNADLLASVFYPEALLFGDVKGQPYKKSLAEYIDGVSNRLSPRDSGKPFKGEILSVKVINSIALAEVKVKMYDFYYHELLSFHKINERWYLVNKMLTDINQ